MRPMRNEQTRGRSSASSSTSTTGRCKRRVVFLRQPSREDQYGGRNRYCYHNLVAPRWTSWSEANPGRRFYGCRNYYQDGGCGFFEWHDAEFGDRETAVIKDLLNDIDKLYEENNQVRRGNDCARLYEELVAIEGEVRNLKAGHEVRESEVRKWQLKFKLALATLLLTWLWLAIMYV